MNRTTACVEIASRAYAARLQNAGISAPPADRDRDSRTDPWLTSLVHESAIDAEHLLDVLERRGLVEFDPDEPSLSGLGGEIDALHRRVDQLEELRDCVNALRSVGNSIERFALTRSVSG